MAHLKKSRRPIILTVEGKAEAVIQDAASYQALLDLAAKASAEEGIRQGLDDVRNGKVTAARDVFDDISAEYGIPG
jgi:PHD/YefM family antitoxin component YafN of YafNO toxin-antitoxin module